MKPDQNTEVQLNEENVQAIEETAEHETKKRFGFGKRSANSADDQTAPDLYKMKRKDLLEIMLAQSKEIDSLRARVEELEAKLADKEFDLDKVGSIAEASLAVTDIFKEAEKAAMIYLENIRRSYEKRSKQHSED